MRLRMFPLSVFSMLTASASFAQSSFVDCAEKSICARQAGARVTVETLSGPKTWSLVAQQTTTLRDRLLVSQVWEDEAEKLLWAESLDSPVEASWVEITTDPAKKGWPKRQAACNDITIGGESSATPKAGLSKKFFIPTLAQWTKAVEDGLGQVRMSGYWTYEYWTADADPEHPGEQIIFQPSIGARSPGRVSVEYNGTAWVRCVSPAL